MKVLSSEHNSPERGYIIRDYPFGRRVRCIKRVWVETCTKGAGKGKQRVGSQTTTKAFNYRYTDDQTIPAPMEDPRMWNKPKYGIFHDMAILYIDPETGYIETGCLHDTGWNERVVQFRDKFAEHLDGEQAARFQRILDLSDRMEQYRKDHPIKFTSTVTESMPI